MLNSGCAWRLLPHDFPPWRTVYHYFRAWRLGGIWESMHAALRERVRVRLKRNPQPSAATIVDSQSVKTTGVGGEERGYDGVKKVKGRKRRYLLVDTQGLVLMAKAHRANVTDLKGASSSCSNPRGPASSSASLTYGWTSLYTGQEDGGAGWVEKVLGWTAEIVRHPKKLAPEEVMWAWVREFNKEGVAIDAKEFIPPKGPRPFLPKRWIVERTFSWLRQNRRMSLWTTRGCLRARKPSSTWP